MSYYYVYLMEIKRRLSYRLDFWISLFATTLGKFLVSTLLWVFIYNYSNFTTIGGYSLTSMIIYYLIAPSCFNIIDSGIYDQVSMEIYSGGLNKYLLYPVSFFRYKYITHLANLTLVLVQFSVIVLLGSFYFKASFPITLESFVYGIASIFLSSYLFFNMCLGIELMAFYTDQVWNFNIIIRYLTHLFGGVILPITLFPDVLQKFIKLFPFFYIINFPYESFVGKLESFWINAGITILWGVLFKLISIVIWNKGIKQYSGIGI